MKFSSLSIILASICFYSSSYAQDSHPGGGGPSELATFTGKNGEKLPSWYTVKTDLILGFENGRYKELNFYGKDPEDFKQKALEVLRTTPVEFIAQEISIEGVKRSCKNFIDEQKRHHIQCDPAAYVTEMENYTAEEQYRFVAHEYFGAAGLELNTYLLSDYIYSSQISQSLHEVTFKLWGAASNEKAEENTFKSNGMWCETEIEKIGQNSIKYYVLYEPTGELVFFKQSTPAIYDEYMWHEPDASSPKHAPWMEKRKNLITEGKVPEITVIRKALVSPDKMDQGGYFESDKIEKFLFRFKSRLSTVVAWFDSPVVPQSHNSIAAFVSLKKINYGQFEDKTLLELPLECNPLPVYSYYERPLFREVLKHPAGDRYLNRWNWELE